MVVVQLVLVIDMVEEINFIVGTHGVKSKCGRSGCNITYSKGNRRNSYRESLKWNTANSCCLCSTHISEANNKIHIRK